MTFGGQYGECVDGYGRCVQEIAGLLVPGFFPICGIFQFDDFFCDSFHLVH